MPQKELSQVEKTALRLKRQQVKREADNIREILFKREEEEKKRAAKEKADIEADAQELREQQEKEREYNERIRKTKEYYVIDKFNRKRIPEGSPTYFGEYIDVRGAWVPHGKGQNLKKKHEDDLFHYVESEGEFVNGQLWGQGKYLFDDGSAWEGQFYQGSMHGCGFMVDSATGDKQEALMIHNELVCFHNELVPGTQIEFRDASLGIPYGSRATLLRHNKAWKFHVRFHEELNPRERQIDFSMVKHFSVLRVAGKAYNIAIGGVLMDQKRTYDYTADTYRRAGASAVQSTALTVPSLPRGNSSVEELASIERANRALATKLSVESIGPTLQIAGSRRGAEMRLLTTVALSPEERYSTNYRENMFEASALGVGAAFERDRAEEEKAKRKAEWSVVLSRRKAEAEAEKQKMIQKEQEKAMDEAAAANLEKRKKKLLEDEAQDTALKAEQDLWEKRKHEVLLQNKLTELI